MQLLLILQSSTKKCLDLVVLFLGLMNHICFMDKDKEIQKILFQNKKRKILDDVYSDLYLNSITLGIGPRASPSYNWLSSWELQNDNNDPQTINWNALRFNRNYYDNLFKTIQNAEKKITGRGDKLTLIFKHSWGVENWLSNEGGNTVIKPALEEEYAENLVIFILWIKIPMVLKLIISYQ